MLPGSMGVAALASIGDWLVTPSPDRRAAVASRSSYLMVLLTNVPIVAMVACPIASCHLALLSSFYMVFCGQISYFQFSCAYVGFLR